MLDAIPANHQGTSKERDGAALQRQRPQGSRVADRVDTRSIADIEPDDLLGYTRCHFFAGIGGWEYALRLAGWPADAPVWTGSCPCQPFSQAGKGRGVEDERHVWPIWRDLIEQCRPPVIFGEQVASKAGRAWLAGVRADLEALGYGVGAADLCAAGVGSPHIRQRLYWVADANRERHDGFDALLRTKEVGRVKATLSQAAGRGTGCGLADPSRPTRDGSELWYDPWSHHRVLECRDGKARRVSAQPGDEPLAHGVPARVVRLRGYGNAIVPQLAAEFVMAYMETTHA